MPDDGHDRLGERVAGTEQRLTTVEGEVARTREHVHELRKDRSAIKLLTQQVGAVATAIRELADSLETKIAHGSEHAVAKILSEKEKERRSSWDYRLKFAAVAIAAGGFVWAILLRFTGSP